MGTSMKLAARVAINEEIIQAESCPKCQARSGEKCRSNGTQWDQGIHRLRMPGYRTNLYTVRFHHHKLIVKNAKER